MKFAPIINPDVRKPAPSAVRVDLRKVFLIGTGLWLLATAVCLVLMACGFAMMQLLIICGSGVAAGLLMLLWEHFDRWNYRRLGE
ncbi:DUF2530 domain-containing protein [Bifidobacterium tibiigranuli]|jgi:uncharacterized membrane protein|uniref:DUF2530 domain-containing protein n=1 Tax=Bifidobacterium tibiigranuli TaxID=2172043 RepID=UPI00235739A4|nr:DUF2530 domain-containing protein [Bifidobacterium tibiigranuli]MCH3973949.1 DUF2530 domain-containing protein [Bifidobacterium tibiigranuli]MCH4203943.1 DUF2530 domain-containing protein [Bifidobacterium tibiigranuli]MCH4274215.1 DUF2530 domain-containing protein [Bifidobacterium tibiigranuli]MCI1672696.1 DUF2530 domain-containing protein [Bifidobacterium tibiigranuli]MCI1712299.1 DUF2530 domain-containing protein [Bifidobacterium tibiigranuli]